MRAADFISASAVSAWREWIEPGCSQHDARAKLERLADTCQELLATTLTGDRRWLTANGEAVLVTKGRSVVTVFRPVGDLRPAVATAGPRDWSCAQGQRIAAYEALRCFGSDATRLLTRQSTDDIIQFAKALDHHIVTGRNVEQSTAALQAVLALAEAVGAVDRVTARLARQREAYARRLARTT